MSGPATPRDPLRALRQPLLPPGARSRAALGLAVAAAEGKFMLQVCASCGAAQYPPREACVACLEIRLPWRAVPDGGTAIAATTLRVTADPYFRSRMPWRIGTIRLDCGPSVVAHLHEAVQPEQRVRMVLRLDKSGQGVMLALPATAMEEDSILRELSCDPRGRRVLVTDTRNAFGQGMLRAFAEAGARTVFAGVADAWLPFPGQDRIGGDTIETVSLDITDAESVRVFAAAFGGRVDIVVNTALHIRPGGVLDRADTVSAHTEMEAAYFGPLRLAQALGPALRAHGADGTLPACAWVNFLSVYALAPLPAFGASAAAQAAGLSLAQSLRAVLRPLQVVNALVGPLDDEWHQAVPPPKVTPAALAAAAVRALREGIEDLAVGDVAQDLLERWKDSPSLLARELAAG